MSTDVSDFEIKLLLDAIYHQYSYDFRNYSLTSVKRRVAAALSHFGVKTISELQGRVLHEPSFFPELLQYLTIPTSEMFRDPQYFLKVRDLVLPILETYPSIKLWIAGCSTGEEVYSYAILLHEAGLLEKTTIYATDINPVSLKKAEQGIFSLEKINSFASNYKNAGGRHDFNRYITTNNTSAIFDRKLIRNVVFADHSLATDTVFSEMQFVSCRNVLIYFEKDLQNRALGLFHESLSRRGFLGIGSKETLRFSNFENEFETLASAEKIYRKK